MPGISFDRAVDYYDATRGFPEGVDAAVRDAIVRETRSGKGSRYLELGVGTGRIALPFSTAGYRYVGVDLSPRMLARFRQRAADLPVDTPPRWQVLVSDVTRLPFGAGRFDVAIAYHVLHLVDDWQQTIREVRRVLRRPGGRLVISGGGPGGSGGAAGEAEPPARRVRRQWGEILAGLGWEVERSRRVRLQPLAGFLREHGATVRSALLTEYDTPSQSVREMADELKARLHSGDWQTPEPIHAEAVRRLERWLAAEYPAPERQERHRHQEWAMVASWGS